METLANSDGLVFIGAGLCALSMMAAAWGLAKVWAILIETIGRNPQVKREVQPLGFIAAGFIEAIALYALVVAIMMISK